jgi:hypothetical protein
MPRKHNAYEWIAEPLMELPSYAERPMFGCLAVYAHGLLMLVLADGDEPWQGVLLPVDRASHASLMAEWPALLPHPVLGKWLYLPASDDSFETVIAEVVERIAVADSRFGVEPGQARRKKQRKSTPAKARKSREGN